MKICEGIGAEDGAFGLGIGEPCENDATRMYGLWHLCEECFKRLMRVRAGRGWGKNKGDE
jgi:hypothetical protein